MKKNKKTDTDSGVMSWRDAAKINLRALKLWWRRLPQLMTSHLVRVVWEALTPYVGIYLSALVIDELAGARDSHRLFFLVALTLASSAVISLVSAIINKWTNTHDAGLWYKFNNIFSEKLLSMDYADRDKTETTALLSTIKQNINGGGWGLNRVPSNILSLISSVLTLFGGVALTVTLFTSKVPDGAGALTSLGSPLFALLIAAVMIAITIISPMLSNKAGSYLAKNVDAHNRGNRFFGFFGFLGFHPEYAMDMRMYRFDKVCEKYNSKKDGVFSSHGIFARYARGHMGLYRAASSAVSVIFTGVVYAFVCLKAWAGAFGLGSVTQYVASVTRLSGSVGGIISTLGDMRNNAPFLELTFRFLDIPNNMYRGSLTVEKRRDRKYEVEFRDVSFRYPGSENYALRHVNMKFEIGRRLAVVGENGSGKTTFIKLLCRLYDPTEGEILLNGIDIRKYNYDEYMSIFSVVFQDFRLFALPLGENVAASADYDKSLARDCLEKAGFGERLRELPDGLGTYLYKDYDKDGVNISGGEAQKIAIARALYKDAPFIILDEPTAALDPVAEAEIYSKFNDIAGDKTAIYISHRLSSCKFCDEIAVFCDGSVIQQGTHEALLDDEGGKYRELWLAQAQYYTEA